MSALERFVVFDCHGDACVGVLHEPATRDGAPHAGVLIVVGGPQYRVGSHRQFALLARALAEAGIPALRFDYRGMGDSDGAARTFETIDEDIACAIEVLVRETGVRRVALWGLCDGASAALMYAAQDDRVIGVVALNPWARAPEVEASTRLRHYYVRRLLSLDFWRKLVTGGVDLRRSTRGIVGDVRSAGGAPCASFLERMQTGWTRFGGAVLVMLSGSDYTAREFETWVRANAGRTRLLRGPRCEVKSFPSADHTFSRRALRDAVAAATIEWIARISPQS